VGARRRRRRASRSAPAPQRAPWPPPPALALKSSTHVGEARHRDLQVVVQSVHVLVRRREGGQQLARRQRRPTRPRRGGVRRCKQGRARRSRGAGRHGCGSGPQTAPPPSCGAAHDNAALARLYTSHGPSGSRFSGSGTAYASSAISALPGTASCCSRARAGRAARRRRRGTRAHRARSASGHAEPLRGRRPPPRLLPAGGVERELLQLLMARRQLTAEDL
jgi:hypothetical protein